MAEINKKYRNKKNMKNKRKCIDSKVFKYLLNIIHEREYVDDRVITDAKYKNKPINDRKVYYNKIILNMLLYYTGARLSEILSLNKVDILNLFEHGSIVMYCKKTKDHRTIFLKNTLKTKFEEQLRDMKIDINDLHENGIVNRWNNKITDRTAENWMTYYFDKLKEKYGGGAVNLSGRPWGFHSYRINYINQIIRSADLDMASKIIGHKNPTTTLIYFRSLERKEKDILDVLDKASF